MLVSKYNFVFESSVIRICLTMSKIGSLRWVRLPRLLEPLVRVRMRIPLRLHPLAIVVELLQPLYEA